MYDVPPVKNHGPAWRDHAKRRHGLNSTAELLLLPFLFSLLLLLLLLLVWKLPRSKGRRSNCGLFFLGSRIRRRVAAAACRQRRALAVLLVLVASACLPVRCGCV